MEKNNPIAGQEFGKGGKEEFQREMMRDASLKFCRKLADKEERDIHGKKVVW